MLADSRISIKALRFCTQSLKQRVYQFRTLTTMEKLFKFLLIGLCIQILAIITTSASTRASKNRSGFGESCNKTMRCKSQSWLVCNPQTFQCTCAKPDEMIYENNREKCVAMIGERCKYGFGSDVESVGLFYEKMDCVSGAACGNEDGICACPVSTYEAAEQNECVPVKSRGANCQQSTECDQTASLICVDGKCECPNDDMLFDDIHGSCRTKAGKNCLSTDAYCVNGSECILRSGICTCVDGMYMSSGNCIPLKGFESHCSSSEECDGSQMLTCINRRCECDPTKATKILSSYTAIYVDFDYNHYSYSVPAGICVGKVGSSCSKTQYCIRNGFCTKYLTCACSDGYSKTSDGLCGLGHNQGCSEENVCSDKFTCTSYLSHRDDIRCRCPSPKLQVYLENECRRVVGGPCEQEIGCIKDAHCVETLEPNQEGSVCECQEGFIEFDAQSCDVAYGFKCDPTSRGVSCDRRSRLDCSKRSGDTEFRCNCPNAHDVFESRLHKCSTVVGFRCDKDYDCIINASCFKKRETSSGRCTCNSGFQYSDENRKCFLEPMELSYENIANIEDGDLDAGNKTKASSQG